MPTSLITGIEIDIDWVRKENPPKFENFVGRKLYSLREYINASNWDDKSKAIIGKSYKKWYRFILWNFKYRWKQKEYKKQYEELMNIANEKLTKQTEIYNNFMEEQKEKINIIKNKVIPELSKFSTDIRSHKNFSNELKKVLDYFDNLNKEE